MIAATSPTIEPGQTKRGGGIPIGFSSLVRAVRRYSLLVFVFALIAIAAGALVWFFLPLPKMTGRLVFLVKNNAPYVVNQGAFNDRDSGNFRQMQMNIMMSQWVLNDALNQPGIAVLPMFEQDKSIDPIEYLRSHLKIDFSLGAEYMRVSLEGNNADELLMMLKALELSYKKYSSEEEMKSRRLRFTTLNNMRQEYIDKVKNIKRSIRDQLATGQTDEISQAVRERILNSMIGQSDSEQGRLNALQRQLVLQINRAENDLKLPPAMRSPVPADVVESYVENDPEVRKLRLQVDSANGRLGAYTDNLKKDLKPEEIPPRVKQIEQERADAIAKLAVVTEQKRNFYKQSLKEIFAKGAREYLDNLKGELEKVHELQEAVMKETKDVIKQLNELKRQGAAAEDLKVELVNFESLATRINNDVLTIQTEIEAPPRVARWEDPHVVPGIEGNRRVKYTAMAAAGFLLLGLGLAQWLEIRHRRIQHIDEVTNGLGLQVLGTVPAMPKGGVSARSNWPHLLTEAVNTTRTMLLSGPHAATTKTLLVTSAMSGEGKTSLTTHLAVSLASAGRRVLLIDADMRRPAVHKVLGLVSKPGLGELLTGMAKLDDVTQASKVAGLHLVAAGTWSREAGASLSTERWSNTLREAAIGYDFVLVDSPPILPVADALAIAKNVDGVLISVMQDLSRYGAVQTACQRLTMVGAKVLGVVVSGVKTSGGYYYYYYDERYSKATVTNAPVPAAPAQN